jgi:hypothetical protein
MRGVRGFPSKILRSGVFTGFDSTLDFFGEGDRDRSADLLVGDFEAEDDDVDEVGVELELPSKVKTVNSILSLRKTFLISVRTASHESPSRPQPILGIAKTKFISIFSI